MIFCVSFIARKLPEQLGVIVCPEEVRNIHVGVRLFEKIGIPYAAENMLLDAVLIDCILFFLSCRAQRIRRKPNYPRGNRALVLSLVKLEF
jgi:hypothetical protein